MKTVGFVIPVKENEKRRVLLPKDIEKIKEKDCLYFEKVYGKILGISDSEFEKVGCNVVSFDEVLKQDIICDPKIGDANYLDKLKEKQIIFGWVHAVKNKKLTDLLLNKKITVIAFEDMFYKNRHIFYKNNILAGEAACYNAINYLGRLPDNLNAVIIGNGNTAHGAYKALSKLGVSVDIYTRDLEELLRENLYKYDLIVNCVLWDVKRRDHIIYREDIKKMKKGSMIIDVSCDEKGAIETSHPTTIDNPIYLVDNIIHYAVDHTPSIFYQTFSLECSKTITEYINDLVLEKDNEVLKNATIIGNGKILDQKIKIYQRRS
ncbi:MAG TPA: N(5)-(carboxyethyl)ornithine synthase [Candidatus Onthousia faecipullorum]|uniref:N(5)-(Carboxyethyl)ornithine synthase n=1 Tax=Candidatus Onthousia faecipullorum TaxID=2840887 RepID=A0A9D1GBS0_9FIRM|nr:N(5)-(carboxyethyl)ornithine synthase [Candidatus Onthousia faecipullorum]